MLGRHGRGVGRAVHLVEVRDELVQVVALDLALGSTRRVHRNVWSKPPQPANAIIRRWQTRGYLEDGLFSRSAMSREIERLSP